MAMCGIDPYTGIMKVEKDKGLHHPLWETRMYDEAKEEEEELAEEWNKLMPKYYGRDYDEDVVEYHELLDDICLAKLLAQLDKKPWWLDDGDHEHDDDWPRALDGKIYSDGYFGEKMFRVGEWKDYRFGKNKKKTPHGWSQSDLFDQNYMGLPKYDFVKASQLPHDEEDLHLRYMRRFSIHSKENASMGMGIARKQDQMAAKEEKKGTRKRAKRGELPKLHPRVEEALGILFEDMARTREFRYDEEEY